MLIHENCDVDTQLKGRFVSLFRQQKKLVEEKQEKLRQNEIFRFVLFRLL